MDQVLRIEFLKRALLSVSPDRFIRQCVMPDQFVRNLECPRFLTSLARFHTQPEYNAK